MNPARFVKTLSAWTCYSHFLFLFSCCSPTSETNRRLTVDEMYLVDSGGQYLWVEIRSLPVPFTSPACEMTRVGSQRWNHWHHSDRSLGNTNIDAEGDVFTGAFSYGEPPRHLVFCSQEAFTRVLMGNIEISRTVFPSGTRGELNIFSLKLVLVSPLESPLPPHGFWSSSRLCSGASEGFSSSPPGVNMEMLGRRALWEVGLNYGHGTGHGVGNYFGVHECEAVCSVGFWCKFRKKIK